MTGVPSFVRSRRGRRTAALVALLAVATAAGTFLQGALSVLSSRVIAEFDISRAQLGVAFTAFSLMGGAASPSMGRLADRSMRGVMTGLFVVAATGVLLAAAAPGFEWLIVAGLIGGLGLAAGNPVTNKIVSERITTRRRGIVIGVKQAGPPLGLLTAGVVLPPLAATVGWRWALALTAAVPLAGLVATRILVEAGGGGPEVVSATATSQSPSADAATTVRYLGAIGLLVAMGAAGLIAFLPLYAQEEVGLSVSVAGFLAAVLGLTGVVSRIVGGALADRFAHASRPMLVLALGSLVAALAVWAGSVTPVLLWVGTVLAGGSMLAWHAVAWLALLNTVDAAAVGRSTGKVQLGNSIGFAIGPPVTGLTVDAAGYPAGWALVAGVFVLAVLLTLAWRRRDARL